MMVAIFLIIYAIFGSLLNEVA